MGVESFTISRTFAAPRERVWQAWTEPHAFGQWFGPKGFTSEVKTFDLRPGGILHSCLKSPDGHAMWAKFVYSAVEAPSYLAWEHSFSDAEGNLTRHPMQPLWPLRLLSEVRLADEGSQTKLTLDWTPLDADEAEGKVFDEGRAGMAQGWGGTFDQLADYLGR